MLLLMIFKFLIKKIVVKLNKDISLFDLMKIIL